MPQTILHIPSKVQTGGGSPPPPPPVESLRSRRSVFDLFFGVILPVTAIAFELFTRISAQVFFDPLPGPAIFLVFAAPFANLLLWWHPKRLPWSNPTLLALANGLSLMIAGFYTLLYLPILPLALLSVIFLIGFLPLAPLMSLFVAIRQRRALSDEMEIPRLRYCLALVAAFLFLVMLPTMLTPFALHGTRSDSPAVRSRALQLLRLFADRDSLLRYCYSRRTPIVGLILPAVPASHAQSIYYQVTGVAYDSVPEPGISRRFPAWDANAGGTEVGNVRFRDLAITSSRMDATVEPASGLGYLEWTIEFRNTSTLQREARALVQLPHKGVVSRVTLWVNGEPREAAFGRRSQVRAAYQNVVSMRRDPLLVTTAGPDQVLVQCFPVPPNSSMKIRLGITSPTLDAAWQLPRFLHTNFETPKEAFHHLWIDAGPETVRRSLTDPDLDRPVSLATRSRERASWTPDPTDPDHFYIQQILEPRPLPRLSKLFVVIDNSISLRPFTSQIGRQVEAARRRIPIELVNSSLAAFDFFGGQDNVPSLVQAQSLALNHPNSAVLWIHGPQPVDISSSDGIKQTWIRRRGRAPVYSAQLVPGDNRILAALDGHRELQALRVSPDRLFDHFTGELHPLTAIRQRLPGRAGDGHLTSAHLARLWAHDEILRAQSKDRAVELATTYHLVTPVSGAVVLETQQQYDAAGLKPVDSSKVPSVPEPGTWALMAIGLAMILLWRRMSSRKPVSHVSSS